MTTTGSAIEYGRIFLTSLQPCFTARPVPISTAAVIEPFGILETPAFLRTDFEQTWLVDHVLVHGQAGVIGGPQKALKTSISIDLAVSLASATRFLGKFRVPRPQRVLLMSAESGGATLKKTYRRVCQAKGIEHPESLPISWADQVPGLSRGEDLRSLHDVLLRLRTDVVIIDPLYLCLTELKQASHATNMFAMGPLLAALTRACLFAGTTPLIVHHMRKAANHGHASSQFAPPELEDLAFSGIQQFARQWLLINRRKLYDSEAGKHELWLSYGGSAGHGRLWGMDVTEGRLDEGFDGRTWAVNIVSTDELDKRKRQARDDKSERERKEAVQEAANEVVRVLSQAGDSLTQNDIKRGMTRGASHVANAIKLALDQARIVLTKVIKAGGRGEHEYDAYALAAVERRPTEIGATGEDPPAAAD